MSKSTLSESVPALHKSQTCFLKSDSRMFYRVGTGVMDTSRALLLEELAGSRWRHVGWETEGPCLGSAYATQSHLFCDVRVGVGEREEPPGGYFHLSVLVSPHLPGLLPYVGTMFPQHLLHSSPDSSCAR